MSREDCRLEGSRDDESAVTCQEVSAEEVAASPLL